ncbi:hypothetical protein DEIPH_ctg021orf0081 [Deinococcus phoenicis]|uniref:Helix-turn-helix domain-containing protein n=1 Tax=Deinococcus phoenicis TaxID=1476583 RepID=A0A016QRS3_9DEIO|nr:helix-turn-helix domain-containing protein [Deinococcus phoenicis]EYB68562.1 hypothetical protein DEIPH_ctg021orf0081 [Deinococcus phoenicis]
MREKTTLATAETGLDRLVYTPEELLPILRMGKNTLNALLRSGTLRSIRSGRRYLIPRDAVLDFLAGRGN